MAQQALGCGPRRRSDGGNRTRWVFSAGTIIPPCTHPHLRHHPAAIFLSSQAASSLQPLSTHHSWAALERNPQPSERSGPFPSLLMDSQQLTECTCCCINTACLSSEAACMNVCSVMCVGRIFLEGTYQVSLVIAVFVCCHTVHICVEKSSMKLLVFMPWSG